MYDLHVKLLVYHFVNCMLPESLLRVYKYHAHEHNIRHTCTTHPICPIVNTEIMHIWFLYSGSNLQSSITKSTFNMRITEHNLKD